mgnify:CR=1 FL=1
MCPGADLIVRRWDASTEELDYASLRPPWHLRNTSGGILLRGHCIYFHQCWVSVPPAFFCTYYAHDALKLALA